MRGNISSEEMSFVLKKALKQNIFQPDDTAIIFQDLTFLKNRVDHIKNLFPSKVLHTVAIKANPLSKILGFLHKTGIGAEAATLSEVYIAQKCGYDPDKIIYNSPAKTNNELLYALKAGIHINADSFHELVRIAGFMEKANYKSNVGIRVNPQVGTGRISITSVAGTYSKFGIPLAEYQEGLLKYFKKYDWLNGIHVHIGSQGCSLEQLVEGAVRVMAFVKKIQPSLDWIDMGGGLPVNYQPSDNAPSMISYSQTLEKKCPELFASNLKVITEFGRYLHANAGWTASCVEYVKKFSNVNTALIHVSADQFMRRCYQPQDWFHKLSVADKHGNIKAGSKKEKYIVAGPLCFGGDIMAKDLPLPVIKENDFILIHDTGAYTLSMWSRHTSRQIPKVIGYLNKGEEFLVLRERESLEDVYNFWS